MHGSKSATQKNIEPGNHRANPGAPSQSSQNKRKIAKELSDLIVYCISVPFTALKLNNVANFSAEIGGNSVGEKGGLSTDDGKIGVPPSAGSEEMAAAGKSVGCEYMSSFSETKAKAIMVDENRMAFQRYHEKWISRVYPKVIALVDRFPDTIFEKLFISSTFCIYHCAGNEDGLVKFQPGTVLGIWMPDGGHELPDTGQGVAGEPRLVPPERHLRICPEAGHNQERWAGNNETCFVILKF